MQKKAIVSTALAAVLLVSSTACGAKEQGIAISGESLNIGDMALRPDGEAGKLYENGGVKLLVPLEYDELLNVTVPAGSEDGVLFSVAEKASVEAAQKLGDTEPGAGALFDIGRITEEELKLRRCETAE